jgi:hypothetical protein
MIEKKIYSIELEGSQKFNENINKVSDSFGKLENTSTSLKKELREAIQELQTLPENSERFQELSKRAGELKDQIGDINQRVNILASDTKQLDAFINIAQGITAGFSIAAGSMALFGVENENVQKTLVKIQSAIAILNGLQTIQNFLNKDSAASIAFANVQRTIEGALESKNIVIKTAATVAQRALNFAMASNPIGLLIVGLGALIGALALYSDTTEESTKATDADTESKKENIKTNSDLGRSIDDLIKKREEEFRAKVQGFLLNRDEAILQAKLSLEKVKNTFNENLIKQKEIDLRNANIAAIRQEIDIITKKGTTEEVDISKVQEVRLEVIKLQTEIERNENEIEALQFKNNVKQVKRAESQGVKLINVAKETKKEINAVFDETTPPFIKEVDIEKLKEDILKVISEIQQITANSINAITILSQTATDTQVSFYEGQIKQLDEQAEALNSQLDELQIRTAEIEAEFDNARGQRRQRLLDDLKKQGEAEQALAKKQEDIAKKKADLEKKQSDARLKQAKLEAQLNAASVSVNVAAAIAVAALNGAKNDPTGGILTAINIAALSATLVATLASAAAKTKQINKELDGFADGGYTGKGGRMDRSGHRVAGVTHDNEYVVPTRVLANPKGAQMVKQLDRMRKGFADGGFTGADFGALNQSATDRTVNDLSTRPIYVAVTDINLANERMDKIKMATVI